MTHRGAVRLSFDQVPKPFFFFQGFSFWKKEKASWVPPQRDIVGACIKVHLIFD